jgi:hypothetical protein
MARNRPVKSSVTRSRTGRRMPESSTGQWLVRGSNTSDHTYFCRTIVELAHPFVVCSLPIDTAESGLYAVGVIGQTVKPRRRCFDVPMAPAPVRPAFPPCALAHIAAIPFWQSVNLPTGTPMPELGSARSRAARSGGAPFGAPHRNQGESGWGQSNRKYVNAPARNLWLNLFSPC